MTVVSVDAQRRIYIPKEFSFDETKVLIIPQGDSYILIPVPQKIEEIDIEESTQELRKKAEKKA
ncbi:MAG: hypothetical protein QXR42_09000, partial [Candidatus Bathyarchaeia archaeon]